MARLLTPATVAALRAQLASDKAHEVANALVLLGLHGEPGIAVQALPLAIAGHSPSPLRYAAIVALINAGQSVVVKDLIRFADPADVYYIYIIDAIGSLCTPAEFPEVLPLLRDTNAGLSSAYYHFREMKSREALDATIAFLTAHTDVLHGFSMDTYLDPILALIPRYWDVALAENIGRLFSAIEKAHVYCHNGRLITAIVRHTAQNDTDATAIRTMLGLLPERLTFTDHVVAPLVDTTAACWIKEHTPQHAERLFHRLPLGAARDVLDQRTPQAVQAHSQVRAEQLAQQLIQDEQETTTRSMHQATIRRTHSLYAVLDAFLRLPKEHYPEIADDQREWLARQVSDELARLDLAHTVTFESENTWKRPSALDPLLAITDYYRFALQDDNPVVLALRSWANEEIANYYRTHGLSPQAEDVLADLIQSREADNVPRNAMMFLRQTGHCTPVIVEQLSALATDTSRRPSLRLDAIERLANGAPSHAAFLALLNDPDPSIKAQAFRHLVGEQHKGTVLRALDALTDADLQAGEVPAPEPTGLDWIGMIKGPFALDHLRQLRRRALILGLARVASLITNTIASIDKGRVVTIIEEQLGDTPVDERQHWRQEAEKLRREARTESAQRTPFDTVIRKLKGATSMIQVKVWCEGDTDRPIFRQLLTEAGEHDAAATLDFVGGWGNFLVKEPERWLDGCRHAVVILDGDVGRSLKKRGTPYTTEGKRAIKLCEPHAITLRILQRYGIENYFPQHACEAILKRDLAAYFPIPLHKPVLEHFSERRPWWRTIIDWRRNRKRQSFYQKRQSEEIATRLTLSDIAGTDLAAIIEELQRMCREARVY